MQKLKKFIISTFTLKGCWRKSLRQEEDDTFIWKGKWKYGPTQSSKEH